jgi:hypothetical protein
VGIDIPDAASEKRVTIDQTKHLLVRGHDRLRQILQMTQKSGAPLQIAERKLAHNEGVPEDFTPVEPRSEPLIADPQMLDPDGRIDEDHPRFVRRRGIAVRPGSLPPRRASRRAASRSINARSASRTKADFSRIPVYASAFASSSSSSARVVRIFILPERHEFFIV